MVTFHGDFPWWLPWPPWDPLCHQPLRVPASPSTCSVCVHGENLSAFPKGQRFRLELLPWNFIAGFQAVLPNLPTLTERNRKLIEIMHLFRLFQMFQYDSTLSTAISVTLVTASYISKALQPTHSPRWRCAKDEFPRSKADSAWQCIWRTPWGDRCGKSRVIGFLLLQLDVNIPRKYGQKYGTNVPPWIGSWNSHWLNWMCWIVWSSMTWTSWTQQLSVPKFTKWHGVNAVFPNSHPAQQDRRTRPTSCLCQVECWPLCPGIRQRKRTRKKEWWRTALTPQKPLCSCSDLCHNDCTLW